MKMSVMSTTQCVTVSVPYNDRKRFEDFLYDQCISFDELGRDCAEAYYHVYDIYLGRFINDVEEL